MPYSVCLSSGAIDLWGPAVSRSGCSEPGVRSDLGLNVFLYSFLEIDSNFKNSYLELGVSKLSEPNFAEFIMKCTI